MPSRVGFVVPVDHCHNRLPRACGPVAGLPLSAAMTPQASSHWRHEATARLRSHWLLKSIGIAVSITAFMCAYFALLNHPQFPVRVMPLQSIDRMVAFVPWAVVPYASLWLYIALVPGLLYLRGEMPRYVLSVTVLSVIGCTIYFFWPTAVPAFDINWSAYPLLEPLKSADSGGNAFPSLHVAFSVFTMTWLVWLLRRLRAPWWLHVGNVAWCAVIVWSTLATRQHVAWDVEAGVVLGAAVALAHICPWRAYRFGAGMKRGEPAC